MKTVGSIALLIAAFLGWLGYSNYSTAARMTHEIEHRGIIVWTLAEGLGANDIDRKRVEHIQESAKHLVIGAVILGLLGIVLIYAGINIQSNSHTIVLADPRASKQSDSHTVLSLNSRRKKMPRFAEFIIVNGLGIGSGIIAFIFIIKPLIDWLFPYLYPMLQSIFGIIFINYWHIF